MPLVNAAGYPSTHYTTTNSGVNPYGFTSDD
jgi:hypothetical protein